METKTINYYTIKDSTNLTMAERDIKRKLIAVDFKQTILNLLNRKNKPIPKGTSADKILMKITNFVSSELCPFVDVTMRDTNETDIDKEYLDDILDVTIKYLMRFNY